MALRQQMTGNQENVHPQIIGRAIKQISKAPPGRSALGDVGNNLTNVTANGALKKDCTTRPQPTKTKKPVINKAVVKKDVTNPTEKTKEITNKSVTVKNKESFKDLRKPPTELGVSKSYSSKQFQLIDPDESSKNEPLMVTEYVGDIYAYLRELEVKYEIRPNYLNDHETTPRMRSVLVNWLAEVAINFKTNIETFHLCIAIVDRYLQDNKTVGRHTLQLVGAAAMFVACKYEEMYIQELADFVYICDDTFSSRQILITEIEILKCLDFSFGRPLSLHFLRRYNKIAQVKSEHHTLGKYLLELTLMEYEMCHVKPSIQAAAACCLSIAIWNEIMDLGKVWTPTMVHYTTYKLLDFKSVMVDMAHMLVRAENSKYQTIRSKYSESKYGKISLDKKLSGTLVKKLTSMFTPSRTK